MTSYEQALERFEPVSATPITDDELMARIAGLQAAMAAQGLKAVWLDASSSLRYYTGLLIGPSERVHGAIVPVRGAPIYVSPQFEVPKLNTMLRLAGDILPWEEHQIPCAMIAERIAALDLPGQGLALDPATPFLFASQFLAALPGQVVPAAPLISAQRQVKSPAEIAIIQTAMQASWQVQRAVWQGLRPGVTTAEVCAFVDAAHRRLGLEPLFVAAQFGEATAYPHGKPGGQTLRDGDMVLIDLGGILHGYRSDITRSYVFGTPTERQIYLWDCERRAHLAGFAAAKPGAPCEAVDAAARGVLTAEGFGPDYAVPGLPHRTGHGLGLDIHEDPFMLRGNATPLQAGMVFSIEPMLCVYGECGVRLEDIVWMGDDGPHWFCPPATSPVTPF
ncbi:MAG TPA: Xaa-Pro peptidase family protein [Paenirhodobacter sp.]